MSDVLIIGIAGGSGSGKTTLADRLASEFGDAVCIVCHDNYYKRHDRLSYEERCKLNYDEPAAFDNELLRCHLLQLRDGHAVDCPVYDYTLHNRSDETVRIEPKKVVIVEGILIFASAELCDLFDVKIFVDTDADVRLIRRIMRDVADRGRDLDSVIMQYLGTVKPMHERYVEPSRRRADIIVPEGGKNLVALEMITERIRKAVKE
ncbi:MAG: uridine kinase [Clostridia bacterium]|nr:uridine kinase [Clostridia bacterium]